MPQPGLAERTPVCAGSPGVLSRLIHRRPDIIVWLRVERLDTDAFLDNSGDPEWSPLSGTFGCGMPLRRILPVARPVKAGRTA
jgi:hypothetical protein